jgi:hypothetical protein
LVNISVGSLRGTSGARGDTSCPFFSKQAAERKLDRMSFTRTLFHPVRPDRRGSGRSRRLGVDKQRNPDASCLHPLDSRHQHRAVGFDIPAMVGGRLQRVIRHERYLVRRRPLDEGQKVLGRITLDVELAPRIVLPQQAHQLEHIGPPDVPLVGPRMHGDPVRSGIERDPGHPGDTRPRHRPAVAQHGDGIEIDGQMGHRHSPDRLRLP